MPPPARARRIDDDETEDEEEEPTDEEDEEEAPTPRRRRKAPARQAHPRPRPSPIRRWRSSEEEESEGPTREDTTGSGTKTIYWRARDSLFFEPLVALAIIVLLLVSLFAYTQNWPPVYVVESDSMQHGSSDQLGLINTGDLVLAQKMSVSDITPYVTGVQTGYTTYGEYGDVLLYWPNGQTTTPIIHRAILYLQWDPNGSYNATDLNGLPCGSASNAVYAYYPYAPTDPGSTPSCRTTAMSGYLELYHIGWDSLNISLDLTYPALGRHSGFLTLGDANPLPDQAGQTTPAISALVEPGWIIGVARGMIPWFGSVKLLLQGQAGEVPPQSWQFMGLTIIGAILIAFGIHYALRTEGIETTLRKDEEEAARAEAGPSADEPLFRRFVSMLRRDRSEDEEEDEDEESSIPRHRTRPPPSPPHSRRGRPVPHVRRNHKTAKKTDSDDEL
ncbi:MAG: S26 family signal peptidase [Thermoplasmata archaeon]|jgi:signal peptidase I